MVKDVILDETTGVVQVTILLTISGCPMRAELTHRVKKAVSEVSGVRSVEVVFDVMTPEQRTSLREMLQGPVRENRFTKPENRTVIFGIASGKGGVGKSSLAANLAVAMKQLGKSVGIIDADVYGHSIPGILGVTSGPTMVEKMMLPPVGYGVKVISMLPFKPGGISQPIAYRGPMLHKALQQFLTDVYWGDLDYLFVDLPPGTGDMAISFAQLLPSAKLIVITTPQIAAAQVAIRSGTLAAQTSQSVVGVIENFSALNCESCGHKIDLFGAGGGEEVASELTKYLGIEVPLLGQIPFVVDLRTGGDSGVPIVVSDPSNHASVAITAIATHLVTLGDSNKPSIIGKSLPILNEN